MAYYAPFYRPTYYDPVQQNPMGQFNQHFSNRQTSFRINSRSGRIMVDLYGFRGEKPGRNHI